jgi:hypothetical protein
LILKRPKIAIVVNSFFEALGRIPQFTKLQRKRTATTESFSTTGSILMEPVSNTTDAAPHCIQIVILIGVSGSRMAHIDRGGGDTMRRIGAKRLFAEKTCRADALAEVNLAAGRVAAAVRGDVDVVVVAVTGP